MKPPMNVDAVAEAIYNSNERDSALSEHPEFVQENFRRQARAAIAAMELTVESKLLDDGMSGVTYSPDGTTTFHNRPQTKMERLVSQWVKVS